MAWRCGACYFIVRLWTGNWDSVYVKFRGRAVYHCCASGPVVGLLPSKQSAGVRFPSGAFFCGSALLYFLCMIIIDPGWGMPLFFSNRDTII